MSKKEKEVIVTEELVNSDNGEIEEVVAVEEKPHRRRFNWKSVVETVIGVCAVFGGGFIVGKAVGGRPSHEDPVDEVVETEEEN